MGSESAELNGVPLPAGVRITEAGTFRVRWWVGGKTHSKTLRLPLTEAGVEQANETRASYLASSRAAQRSGKRFSTEREYREVFKTARRRGGDRYHLTRADEEALVARASGHCELTGLPFQFERRGHNRRRPYMASLDRIDAEGGYTRGNVRLVCVAVNLALNDWGEKILLEIAEGLIRQAHRRKIAESGNKDCEKGRKPLNTKEK